MNIAGDRTVHPNPGKPCRFPLQPFQGVSLKVTIMPVSPKTREQCRIHSVTTKVGDVYEMWTVIDGPYEDKNRNYRWLCRCTCGTTSIVHGNRLRSGKSKGCRKCRYKNRRPSSEIGRELAHVQKDIFWRLRRAASGAIRRCKDKHNAAYVNYGGRGIKVNFVDEIEFVKYLLTLPGHNDPTLVLDRTDNNGHYEVGNLGFVTYSESGLNRRVPDTNKGWFGCR